MKYINYATLALAIIILFVGYHMMFVMPLAADLTARKAYFVVDYQQLSDAKVISMLERVKAGETPTPEALAAELSKFTDDMKADIAQAAQGHPVFVRGSILMADSGTLHDMTPDLAAKYRLDMNKTLQDFINAKPFDIQDKIKK